MSTPSIPGGDQDDQASAPRRPGRLIITGSNAVAPGENYGERLVAVHRDRLSAAAQSQAARFARWLGGEDVKGPEILEMADKIVDAMVKSLKGFPEHADMILRAMERKDGIETDDVFKIADQLRAKGLAVLTFQQ